MGMTSLTDSQRVKRLLTVPNVLTTSWAILLWYGESYIFKRAISKCQWDNWEADVSPFIRLLNDSTDTHLSVTKVGSALPSGSGG